MEFFRGAVSVRRFSGFGKRKRSLYDEPSYEHVYREDEGDYYDDNDNKDYYFYDGRRKKEHYIYHRRKRTVFFTVTLNGNNQVVRVVFQSNASGSASGFRALFAEEGDIVVFFVLLQKKQNCLMIKVCNYVLFSVEHYQGTLSRSNWNFIFSTKSSHPFTLPSQTH